MKGGAWLGVAALTLLTGLACNTLTGRGPTGSLPEVYTCEVPRPALTDADREHAEAYASAVFDAEGWFKAVRGEVDYVDITWMEHDGTAKLQYFPFTCPYTAGNLAYFFTDDSFTDSILYDYTAVTKIAQCAQDNFSLYEYTGTQRNVDYRMRYWVVAEDDTHLLTLLLVFPDSRPNTLSDYSERLFPDLSACPR